VQALARVESRRLEQRRKQDGPLAVSAGGRAEESWNTQIPRCWLPASNG
jgi:hypothetical protein